MAEQKMKLVFNCSSREDLILFSFFWNVDRGFYVDIGANDPCSGNTTKVFYDKGWRGVNIEPLPDMYAKLCADRPDDINLNMGIGDKNSEMELLACGGVSTFNDFGKKSVTKMFGAKDSMKVKVMKLADALKTSPRYEQLLRKQGGGGGGVHFCKIDVEGFEKQVLEGIDFSEFRPWMFMIEDILPWTTAPSHEFWEYILLDNGYIFVYEEGPNRFYLDKKHEDLLKTRKTGEEIESEYEPYLSIPYDTREDAVHANLELSRYYKLGKTLFKPILPIYKAVNKLRFKFSLHNTG